MEFQTLLFDEENHIGKLTLNRPKNLNAVNHTMIEELEQVFADMQNSATCRVLVLTGGGEKGFCAGLDMKETAVEMFARSAEEIYLYQSRMSQLYYKMRCLPQPIIAAVHGAASGAGFSFAMASDVRVITTEARFNAAYINIGVGGADLASSYFLPKLIGSGRANEFLLTGEFMSAEEAMNLGFASRMVAKDKLLDVAFEIAGIMVSKSPAGLRMTKEAINQNLGLPSLEQVLHLENRNQAFLIAALKLQNQS